MPRRYIETRALRMGLSRQIRMFIVEYFKAFRRKAESNRIQTHVD